LQDYPKYSEVRFTNNVQFPSGWSTPYQDRFGDREVELSFSLNGIAFNYSIPYAFKQRRGFDQASMYYMFEFIKLECKEVKGYYDTKIQDCTMYWYLTEVCVTVTKQGNVNITNAGKYVHHFTHIQ
jgi:hypothetical protein